MTFARKPYYKASTLYTRFDYDYHAAIFGEGLGVTLAGLGESISYVPNSTLNFNQTTSRPEYEAIYIVHAVNSIHVINTSCLQL